MLERKNETSGPRNRLTEQKVVEREVSTLLSELAEMARQISSHLDSRSARLEDLIRQADARIERLEALGATAASPPIEPTNGEPTNNEVYALADQGCSAKEIAQRLDRPKGEIELILALRGR